MTWSEWASSELFAIRQAHQWRSLHAYDANGSLNSSVDQTVDSFASNDYLGLSTHPYVRAAAIDAIEQFGVGASASRLVSGTRNLHLQLEQALAKWQHTERALVFPSGYAANLAAVSVFGVSDVTVFSDELNHASIIDGCRLARAKIVIYRHNDINHLADLLRASAGRKLIVSETVFSMDGDVAPIRDLARLSIQHDALLILDEAHSVLEDVHDFGELAVLRVGTLSKTLGSLGGWIAGSSSLVDLLINRARTFIFTTALSPADTAAALAALSVVNSDEGARLRAHLKSLVQTLAPEHRSPILPYIFGAEEAALAASQRLAQQGIYVPAIRPPTVARGTSRLRVGLSAKHTLCSVERLKQQLNLLPCQPIVRTN